MAAKTNETIGKKLSDRETHIIAIDELTVIADIEKLLSQDEIEEIFTNKRPCLEISQCLILGHLFKMVINFFIFNKLGKVEIEKY